MFSQLKMKDIASFGFIFTLLLAAYSPAIVGTFGFSDDYSTYFSANMSHISLVKWDIMSGRPIYAALRYISQHFIETTSDFRIFRIYSVASIISLSFLLYLFLRKVQFPGGIISWCLTPVLLCCLPSVALFGAWSTCFPYVTSIILAGLAYINLNYNSKITGYYRLPISFLLLALSFAIYQPTGMSFALFMLIDNCLSETKLNIKKVFLSAMTIASGMISSLIFSKILPLIIYGESFPRSALATSIIEKFHWFLDKPFHDAVANYSVFYTPTYFTISLIIFILSFFIISTKKDGIKKAALAILIIAGSFSPNLIIAESWVSYRSLISLDLCIGALLAFCFATLTSKLYIKHATLILLSGYAMLSCNTLIYTNFVKQYNQELIILKSAIKESVTKDYNGYLMFDLSQPQWDVFSRTKYDEFGAPSIQIAWAISGFADSIRNDMHYNYKIDESNSGNAVLFVSPQKCEDNCKVIRITEKLKSFKE